MATVRIDVELDEFDTDDIIAELVYRIKNKQHITRTKILKQATKELSSILSIGNDIIEVKTLDDEQKMNHLIKVFSKYTSAQIEVALPE